VTVVTCQCLSALAAVQGNTMYTCHKVIQEAQLSLTNRARPCGNHAKRCMNEKIIQCLPNSSQHVPTYLQHYPSYSNRKCKKSPFSRTAAQIFVSPGDVPATITQYVAWMERQFNACHVKRLAACTYCFCNSIRVIRC